MVAKKLPVERLLKTGKETFRVRGEDVDITILDYWRHTPSCWITPFAASWPSWSAQALKRTNKPRREWVAFDVQTESGIRVEVKSASYYQSWLKKPSRSFDISPQKVVWDGDTNESTFYARALNYTCEPTS